MSRVSTRPRPLLRFFVPIGARVSRVLVAGVLVVAAPVTSGGAQSARVTDAFDNVIPYLERAFADDTAVGAWVLKQCPENYAVEARSRYAAMHDKSDPHVVAAMISEVISTAQSAKGDLVKHQKWSCVASERRPQTSVLSRCACVYAASEAIL